MKIERLTLQSCCGGTSTIFKIDRALSKNFLNILINLGYSEAEHFTKAGILYATNQEFIVTGPFGTNKLQVKCRKSDCDKKLNDFESLLALME